MRSVYDFNCPDFVAYQEAAARTRSDDAGDLLSMCVLGLVGEAGEVAELIKKHRFHRQPLVPAAIEKELGDVLWYLANLADVCGLSLERIAAVNLQKLRERHPAGFDPSYHNKGKVE